MFEKHPANFQEDSMEFPKKFKKCLRRFQGKFQGIFIKIAGNVIKDSEETMKQ